MHEGDEIIGLDAACLKSLTKSKIVCTIGPSSDSPEMIKKLSDTGMDIARLNFSHGGFEHKKKLVDNIRNTDPMLGILCDIQGPKIRIGEITGGPLELHSGHKVTVTTESIAGNQARFSISHHKLHEEISVGGLIYINDGIVCLQVEEISERDLHCKVLSGGLISSRKGVNLPDADISLTVPTSKDVEDLEAIAKLDPEYVAISFIKDAEDVRKIRNILSSFGNDSVKLISKIERPAAVKNFDEILKESDGIMVARGDLGVEIPAEHLIPAQKDMIKKCNIAGKPVIVATQMLESMINAPVPTRAEVSDVFNAISDGADAVMLSAETAAGKYPIEAVSVMEKIIRVSESRMSIRNPDDFDTGDGSTGEIIGHLVFSACKEFIEGNYNEGKILCLTKHGYSAAMISKYRPRLPIIAVVTDIKLCRELRLLWGVEPMLLTGFDSDASTVNRLSAATKLGLKKGYFHENERIIVSGNIFCEVTKTNMLAIFPVSHLLTL